MKAKRKSRARITSVHGVNENLERRVALDIRSDCGKVKDLLHEGHIVLGGVNNGDNVVAKLVLCDL